MNRNTVTLVAIAKDEAPYLAEWISHHLSMNIDNIKIYINNTSDQSETILKKINNKYKNVSYENVDYILDKEYRINEKNINPSYVDRNKIQSYSYKKAINELSDSCDYLLFLDIDEFFYNPTHNIKDIIPNDYIGSIRIRWLLEPGQHEQFSTPIKEKLLFTEAPNKIMHVKSLVSTNANDNINIINSHHINNGENISYLEPQGEGFILHRWLRSENEYLSTLVRGDTVENSELGLKLNRNGWSENHTSIYNVESEKSKKLKDEYNIFVENCDLYDIIKIEKEKTLSRAKKVQQIIKNHIKNHKDIIKILKGTKVTEEINGDFFMNDNEIDYLRDLAVQMESTDINESLKIMSIVEKFRPNGPFIKKKISEYKASKSEKKK